MFVLKEFAVKPFGVVETPDWEEFQDNLEGLKKFGEKRTI